MAWQDEMDVLLRVLVNDVASTTYTDDTIEQTLVCAAFQVSQEMLFSQVFKVDMANIKITPDPTVDLSAQSGPNTRDESYINLVCLKAACIIDRGAASVAASQAIAVKDGASAIDLRDTAKSKLALLKSGWCAVYEDARMEYRAGQVRIAGAAVMTPFRIYAMGGWGSGFNEQVPGRSGGFGSFGW